MDKRPHIVELVNEVLQLSEKASQTKRADPLAKATMEEILFMIKASTILAQACHLMREALVEECTCFEDTESCNPCKTLERVDRLYGGL